MNAVVLHQGFVKGHTFHEELNPRYVKLPGKIAIDTLKCFGVSRTVIGRNADSEQNHRRPDCAAGLNHAADVGLHGIGRNTAQTVVAAEFENHHVGREILQRSGNAGSTALGRIPTYAGVDDPMFVPL